MDEWISPVTRNECSCQSRLPWGIQWAQSPAPSLAVVSATPPHSDTRCHPAFSKHHRACSQIPQSQLHSLQYWQSSPIPRSTGVFSEFQQEIVGAGKRIVINAGISDPGRRGSLRKEQWRHPSLPKSLLLCLCLGLILLRTHLCTSGFTVRLKFKFFNLPSTALTYLQAFASPLPSFWPHRPSLCPPHPNFFSQGVCKHGPSLLAPSHLLLFPFIPSSHQSVVPGPPFCVRSPSETHVSLPALTVLQILKVTCVLLG